MEQSCLSLLYVLMTKQEICALYILNQLFCKNETEWIMLVNIRNHYSYGKLPYWIDKEREFLHVIEQTAYGVISVNYW